MRNTLLAAAAVLAMCTTASAKMPADYGEIAKVANATVQVNGNCSGQVIQSQRDAVSGRVSTLILTAKHCVGPKADEHHRISFPLYDAGLNPIGERIAIAKVAGRSADSDIAILRLLDTDTLHQFVAPLAAADVRLYQSEDVIVLGFPRGMALTVTRGSLGPRERALIGGTVALMLLRATAPLAPGSSGGGLYHIAEDGSYQLIGIVTAGISASPFMGYHTPIDQLRAYLKVAAPEVN
jgi:S1-C subfamily serine protease